MGDSERGASELEAKVVDSEVEHVNTFDQERTWRDRIRQSLPYGIAAVSLPAFVFYHGVKNRWNEEATAALTILSYSLTALAVWSVGDFKTSPVNEFIQGSVAVEQSLEYDDASEVDKESSIPELLGGAAMVATTYPLGHLLIENPDHEITRMTVSNGNAGDLVSCKYIFDGFVVPGEVNIRDHRPREIRVNGMDVGGNSARDLYRGVCEEVFVASR